jgi:predicted transcriptional regulator
MKKKNKRVIKVPAYTRGVRSVIMEEVLDSLLPRFKAMKKELGLSEEALAYKIGISIMTISRWGLGKTKPHPSTISVVKRFLDDYDAAKKAGDISRFQ